MSVPSRVRTFRSNGRLLACAVLGGVAGALWAVGAAALALLVVAALALFYPRAARAEDVGERAGPPILPLSADARAVLDVAPDACVILGEDGLVMWVNRTAVEQFGNLAVGRPFSFAIRVPELIHAVEQVARTGLAEHARWSQKVPTSAWFEAFVSPFELAGEASGGPRHAIAIYVHDLSERKRLERMREDFVANASHELRTPLSALTGMIETLQGPARDDRKTREEFLVIMREQAERMRRLTDALLSLSRIEMRAHVRPTHLIELGERVRYAVETARAIAKEAGVVIELAAVDDPLLVRGDADELAQVVENLIENAVKYGGEGGRVLVVVARDERLAVPSALVSVEDFGRGIPPEHVPRLTERFYRVDVEESRARRGTGLGLAIVKHIVARHRGRLNVRSELGAGSTFTVRIPLALAPENAPHAPPDPPAPPVLS